MAGVAASPQCVGGDFTPVAMGPIDRRPRWWRRQRIVGYMLVFRPVLDR